MEYFLQLVAEFVLQAIFELLVEWGFHAGRKVARPVNAWWAAIGYAILGAVLGWFSLLLFPSCWVKGEVLRIVNLVITPIGTGLLMCAMGAWRAKRGDAVLRIDRFAYGYLFALALAAVRFALGE